MNIVFESGARTDWEIKRYGESNYQFLDKSAWPLAEFAREFINHWAGMFPTDKEWVSMIKSKDDKQHDAAILELLMFAICRKAGLAIQKNVVTPGVKLPDFTLNPSTPMEIFMECSLAASALETSIDNRKKESVMDIIEDLTDYPFFINVDFDAISDQSISQKEFRAFLNKIRTENEQLPSERLSGVYIYQAQGWSLRITLIRKNGPVSRSRGYQLQPTRIINNFKPLFTALNDKRPSRYNFDDRPYIVCIGVDDLTVHEYELSEALFAPNNPEMINLNLGGKGFFINNGKSINTSVSAVIFCEHLKIFGLASTQISLWHNPFAINPLPTGLFPFKEYSYQLADNALKRIHFQDCANIVTLLDIDEQRYSEGFRLENRQVLQSPT
jgi:hypothetical protein